MLGIDSHSKTPGTEREGGREGREGGRERGREGGREGGEGGREGRGGGRELYSSRCLKNPKQFKLCTCTCRSR